MVCWRIVAANHAYLRLWQIGTKTCRLTPASEPPPYWVTIYNESEPISQRSFASHDEAHAYAIDELRRIPTNGPQPPLH
jgi:hypothetical protein